MSSAPEEDRPVVAVAAPEQLRAAAEQLRSITPVQATQAFARILSARAVRVIADALDECARLRMTSVSTREKRAEERADNLAILATSRRLPLAAVEALVRKAEAAGRASVSTYELRRALSRTEADHDA